MYFERLPDIYDRHCEYEAEEERWLSKRPKCDCCGNPITDDTFYDINGEYLCEECMNDRYLVCTDNYID
jgi:formylmethanofuran dehydrogenase subunit E